VLDHATSEIASGSKLGTDATKKLPGEGFKRPRVSRWMKALTAFG
jgi:4-hydroxy-3-polyprenylbenzoate decarboxylase